MSDYDKLTKLFDGSALSLGKASSRPTGGRLDRTWKFHLNEQDRELFELPTAFVDYIKDRTGLDAGVLYSEKDAGAGAMTFMVLVGILDPDPAKTWAIYVDASVPERPGVDAYAYFNVIESSSRIVSLVEGQAARAITSAARTINVAMAEYSKGDPDKVCELLDYLSCTENANGRWLSQWKIHLMREHLDEATPTASKAARKARL